MDNKQPKKKKDMKQETKVKTSQKSKVKVIVAMVGAVLAYSAVLAAAVLMTPQAAPVKEVVKEAPAIDENPSISYEHDVGKYGIENPQYIPNQLVVKFKEDRVVKYEDAVATFFNDLSKNNTIISDASFIQATKVTKTERKSPNGMDRIYKLEFENNNLDSVISELEQQDNIEYAVRNMLVRYAYTPTDPLFEDQWHLTDDFPFTDWHIEAELAWDITMGSEEVVVAVIDSGITYDHEDLEANIWLNENEIVNNGIDDDNNGYIDDDMGWDFVGEDIYNPIPDNDPMDGLGHGTHVAGIVAAPINDIGVVGVCPNCQLMNLKVGDDDRYLDGAAIISAIDYAISEGVNIINASYGMYGVWEPERDAVNDAYAAGILFVAAAGNDHTDALHYPSAYENTLSVAATMGNGYIAGFSNYGPTVDIAAPGVNILSTLPVGDCLLCDPTGTGYYPLNGTSMASPIIAGIAGLMLSNNPDLSLSELRNILKTEIKDGIVMHYDHEHYIGTGIVNAHASLLREDILDVNIDFVNGGLPLGFVQSFDVNGHANGTDFVSYELSLVSGVYPDNPSDWTVLVQSNSPAEDGSLLTELDASGLDGWYSLKLVAYDSLGQETIDMQAFWISNAKLTGPDNSAFRSGDVVEITGGFIGGSDFINYALEWGYGEEPTAWYSTGMDIDDPESEILDGTLGYWTTPIEAEADDYTVRFVANYSSGPLYRTIIVNVDPTIKEGWPQYVDYRLVSPSVGVADIDDDGYMEIIMGESKFEDTTGKNVYAFNHDGTMVNGWPLEDVVLDRIRTSPVVIDIDKDDHYEIFLGTSSLLQGWDSNGNSFGNWPVMLGGEIYGGPVVEDFDNNGSLDVLATTVTGKIAIWDMNGNILYDWPVELPEFTWSTPPVGDIDGDGDLELVVAGLGWLADSDYIYAYHHDGTAVTNWPVNFSYNNIVAHSPTIVDIDQNGTNEIIYCHDKLYAFNGDSTLYSAPGWPINLDSSCAGTGARNAIAGDIDSDGDIEIIVNNNNKLFAFHHDGTVVAGWPGPYISELLHSTPVLGDIDNDGFQEIIISAPANHVHKVYAFNHDATLVPGWPKSVGIDDMIANSGQFPQRSTPVITDIDNDGQIDIVLTQGNRVYVWEVDSPYRPGIMEWPMYRHDPLRTGKYSPPCITPTDGMVIEEDIILCRGEHRLDNGIQIGSDNVSITCEGTVLNGQRAITGSAGISTLDHDNLEINNCTITNYTIGIDMDGSVANHSDSVLIKNNRFYSNGNNQNWGGTAVDMVWNEDVTIEDNFLFRNSIHSQESQNLTINNNNIFLGMISILANQTDVSNNVIINNFVNSNIGNAIWAVDSDADSPDDYYYSGNFAWNTMGTENNPDVDISCTNASMPLTDAGDNSCGVTTCDNLTCAECTNYQDVCNQDPFCCPADLEYNGEFGCVNKCIAFDYNADHHVTVADFAIFVACFGSNVPSCQAHIDANYPAEWNLRAEDLDPDGSCGITVADFAIFASTFNICRMAWSGVENRELPPGTDDTTIELPVGAEETDTQLCITPEKGEKVCVDKGVSLE